VEIKNSSVYKGFRRYIMGGGGKQPSSTSSTSEVTTTTVPKYLKPYLTDVATRAQAEPRTPYQA